MVGDRGELVSMKIFILGAELGHQDLLYLGVGHR
jgi:hypothetical protein